MTDAAVIDSDNDASTADLVKQAVEEGRELLKLEVALAKREVESELTRLRSVAIAWAVAAWGLSVGSAMALYAVAVASGAEIAVAVAAAIALFAVAVVGGLMGYRTMPAKLLDRTRDRLGADLRDLRDVGERAHGSSS